jgi:hypothetical protein
MVLVDCLDISRRPLQSTLTIRARRNKAIGHETINHDPLQNVRFCLEFFVHFTIGIEL